MIRPIILWPDAELRATSNAIDLEALAVSPVYAAAVRQLLGDLEETMWNANGIGLAAPQIGVKDRLIVVAVRTKTALLGADEKPALRCQSLINPVIVEKSGDVGFDEGCLSMPGLVVKVVRRKVVRVQYFEACEPVVSAAFDVANSYACTTFGIAPKLLMDLRAAGFQPAEMVADDLPLSAEVQHEIDHLDGKILTDHLSALKREQFRKRMKVLKASGFSYAKKEASP